MSDLDIAKTQGNDVNSQSKRRWVGRRGVTIYIYICHIQTYIHTYIHTYIPTYLHTQIPTYMQYMHTCIHAYIHTYIHTYVHTYMHTHAAYISIYIYVCIYICLYIYACICTCRYTGLRNVVGRVTLKTKKRPPAKRMGNQAAGVAGSGPNPTAPQIAETRP